MSDRSEFAAEGSGVTGPLAVQVELFAELMVRFDDAFCERASLLAAAGLDETRCRDLLASWRTRFERDATGALAERFAEAYAERRAALMEERRREGPAPAKAEDPRFLNATALGFRAEAAKVAREPEGELAPMKVAPPPAVSRGVGEPPAPAAIAGLHPRFRGTEDISAHIPRAMLPFAPATGGPSPASVPGSPPSARVDSGTADISAFVPRPLVPFASASKPPPAAAPAPRRLIRFDPQTGLPLPAPIWVDLPSEPEGHKK